MKYLPAILIALLAFQQAKQYHELKLRAISRERMDVYRNIPEDSVVLCTKNGTEVSAFSGCWLFTPTPINAEYVCAASTEELIERVKLAREVLAGGSQQKYRLDYIYDYDRNRLEKIR